ncbi:MAG: hypothetical protein IJ418_02045 [Clostridia bacterium]|nr:hypothetical protein [Clostridia bacterium]
MAGIKVQDVLRGVSIEKPMRESAESLHIPGIPEKVTVNMLVNTLLCCGIKSPCEMCGSMCRYGREWLKLKEEGKVPEKYIGWEAARQERVIKAKMCEPDVTADLLRKKAELLHDDELLAAAMVIEQLVNRNNLLKEKLEKAKYLRVSDKRNNARQLRDDLVLLTAYTGYRLIPLKQEKRVVKIFSDILGEKVADVHIDEEAHARIRENLRFSVGEIIARGFGMMDKEDLL